LTTSSTAVRASWHVARRLTTASKSEFSSTFSRTSRCSRHDSTQGGCLSGGWPKNKIDNTLPRGRRHLGLTGCDSGVELVRGRGHVEAVAKADRELRPVVEVAQPGDELGEFPPQLPVGLYVQLRQELHPVPPCTVRNALFKHLPGLSLARTKLHSQLRIKIIHCIKEN
jgi:hypothetical protein